MRRCLVGVTIGVVLGCADGGGDAPAPRFGDACEDGEPARCGHGQGGTNVPRNVVLVCDGGTWDEGVRCGEFSECSDDASGGVLCEAGDEPAIVYGEHTGNCDTDGAQACSFERDFLLACEAGKWNIATNCSTEVQHCALQSGEFVCA